MQVSSLFKLVDIAHACERVGDISPNVHDQFGGGPLQGRGCLSLRHKILILLGARPLATRLLIPTLNDRWKKINAKAKNTVDNSIPSFCFPFPIKHL